MYELLHRRSDRRITPTYDIVIREDRYCNIRRNTFYVERLAFRGAIHRIGQSESTANLRATVEKDGEHIRTLDSHMIKLTETMDRLANIVIRHEERLDAMDGGHEA